MLIFIEKCPIILSFENMKSIKKNGIQILSTFIWELDWSNVTLGHSD